jgi:hypothetical protein
MRLDSVRALKAELAGPAPGGTVVAARGRTALDVPATRLAELGPVRPGVALGVAPAGPGDFRLAVRVQDRRVGAARLDALRAAARGEVDVEFVGRVVKRQAVPWHQARQRPLLIGGSVGHHAITAGTIGAVVTRADDDARLVLSNNHVLADENRARLGDDVLQPGAADGGTRRGDAVAALERFVRVDAAAENRVDCALARLDPGVEADPRTLTGLGDLDPAPVAPQDADRVAKVGRTTGLTRGQVTAFEVDDVVVEFSIGALRFDDQVEVAGTAGAAFSAGGDSGSLIVTADGLRPVALLFAGGEQGGPFGTGLTYANPIGTVLGRLGARFA